MFTSLKRRDIIVRIISLIALTIGAILVMMPLVWMVLSSLKSPEQGNKMPPEWLPKRAEKVTIDGKSVFVYEMPVNGAMMKLALVSKKGPVGTFVDPANPAQKYELNVNDGERVMEVSPHWQNYVERLNQGSRLGGTC